MTSEAEERPRFVTGGYGQHRHQWVKMEVVILHRVGLLAYFCPKQGQDFKPPAAPLYPNMGQVTLPPSPRGTLIEYRETNIWKKVDFTAVDTNPAVTLHQN